MAINGKKAINVGEARVVAILMKRDGCTKAEAKEQIDICREELLSGNYEAIQDVLGLEDDYLVDIL